MIALHTRPVLIPLEGLLFLVLAISYPIFYIFFYQESNNHKDVQFHLFLSARFYRLRNSLLRYQRVSPRLYDVWTRDRMSKHIRILRLRLSNWILPEPWCVCVVPHRHVHRLSGRIVIRSLHHV
jgi:hypothetical protein